MNANLLTAALLNPALAAGGARGAPSLGSGVEAASGPAFARVLDGARQSTSPMIEPARAPNPPSREPEAARQNEAPPPSQRPAAAADRPRGERGERVESNESEPPQERAPRGNSTTRTGESSRRPTTPTASRKEAAGAKADTSAALAKGPRAEPADDEALLPGQLRSGRTSGASEADAAVAVAADASAPQRTLPEAPAELAGAALRDRVPHGGDGGAQAGGESAGLDLQTATRSTAAISASLATEPGQSTGAHGIAPTARQSVEEPASPGAIDVGALGLRTMPADSGSVALAATGDRGPRIDGTLAVAQGSTALPGPLGGFAAALAATGPATTDAAATVREAGLSSALGSDAFAHELGAQVSVFVRDGVQQARLHLNPQELGPVLVRIQLEGQAAQVHMAAEQQPTRQALEQALPALASQLSEAGITLTGGGVFERPPQGSAEREARGDESSRSASFGAGTERTAGSTSTVAEPGRWSRPRGLVDLIA